MPKMPLTCRLDAVNMPLTCRLCRY